MSGHALLSDVLAPDHHSHSNKEPAKAVAPRDEDEAFLSFPQEDKAACVRSHVGSFLFEPLTL